MPRVRDLEPRRSTPPSSPGTYVVLLESSAIRRVRIGALGTLDLEPGFYAYVGSARGPGGLAARLSHHRRRSRSPHWHVDHLRRHTVFREAWFACGRSASEHRFARLLAEIPGATIPLPRFGASDCRCRSHLFRFDSSPGSVRLGERLARGSRLERWVPR